MQCLIKFWNSELQDVMEPNGSKRDETNTEERSDDAIEHDRLKAALSSVSSRMPTAKGGRTCQGKTTRTLSLVFSLIAHRFPFQETGYWPRQVFLIWSNSWPSYSHLAFMADYKTSNGLLSLPLLLWAFTRQRQASRSLDVSFWKWQ